MWYFWLGGGVLMGLGSVLHCAAMCGPIMMATSNLFKQNKSFTKSLNMQFLGKTITYILIGTLFGFLGKIISLTVMQERLMLVSGIVLIIISLQGWLNVFSYSKVSKNMNVWIGSKIKKLIQYPLLIGILHGLIPCGLVYGAGIASLASHSVLNGSLFMLGFGLGTLPILATIAVGSSKLMGKFRNKKWLQHAPSLILGVLFFIKGMGLNIPYLSPKVVAQKPKASCCREE